MTRTEPDRGTLSTLSFVLDAALMGTVYVHPLPSGFATAWKSLPKPRTKDAQRPIASLTTAARAVTGQRLVFTDPGYPALTGPWAGRSVIVTPEPLDMAVLRRLVREWEVRLPEHQGRDTLSALLERHEPTGYPLAEVLHLDPEGRFIGPAWALRVAGWRVANLLAAQPLEIDGLDGKLPLLLDSDGDLLTWDAPFSKESVWTDEKTNERRRRIGYAMDRVHVEVEPAPGGRVLVAHLEARVARVAHEWHEIKNALIQHPANPNVILKVPVAVRHRKGEDGQWRVESVTYKGATAQIVEACGITPLPDPATVDFETLGPVRPVHTTARHPIGKGAGSRLMMRLEEHATTALNTEPLHYKGTAIRVPRLAPEPTPVVPGDKLRPAITAAGYESLGVVALYDSPEWKTRVLEQLARDYQCPDLTDLPDQQPHDLAPGVKILTVRVPELIRHGAHDRQTIVNQLPWLRPHGSGHLLAILAETSFPGENEADAKPILKALFAPRGLPSQFLTMSSAPADLYQPTRAERIAIANAKKAEQEPPPISRKDDHPAQVAFGGLLTDCGIIDDRLAAAACHQLAGDTALDGPATLVGLWTRQHKFPRVNGRAARPAVMAITLVALQAVAEPDAYWTPLMYSDRGWLPLAAARAAHHAGPIGKPGHNLRDEDGGPARIRDYVEQALTRLPGNGRLVVFTEQQRAIWPALANSRHGDGLLPGTTLSARGNDVAVVRVANGITTPRPTRRIGGTARHPDDPLKASMPEKVLYSSDHGGAATWLFASESRQHKGGERTGTDHTRRTLPDAAIGKIGNDFHAITRTEYTIPMLGSWSEDRLVGLAARLSQQSASWGGRTQLPVPLHLAKNADEKHPQYIDRDEDD
jgi:hypothetical protein